MKKFSENIVEIEPMDDPGSVSLCDLVSRCESCHLYFDCYNFDDSFSVSFVSDGDSDIKSL